MSKPSDLYGCHSTVLAERGIERPEHYYALGGGTRSSSGVSHVAVLVKDVMSRVCRYDQAGSDPRCAACTKPGTIPSTTGASKGTVECPDGGFKPIQEPAPHTCKFCGRPSWVDPSDQAMAPDYCHEADHGHPPWVDR